ncbi:ABC transporter ATP-binding protein [Fusobacterium sp.]|uniref:ABC transporter ATP-binding protein n=1 Tax=Fusobacterium sp. TaxID=68766 RepID=UPI0029001B08|nr:ABC transporter ATP-binding protein [Fusobacterium sp.]MDU1910793.1 ABC transporter ATP-binding protein [Fusobacterium sp.]
MRLINIVKSYGDKKVLDGITLDIEEGKITAILGESGSGKSTLLNIIAGKIKDYKGKVIFEAENEKGISYIFQEDTLIPWKTVYGNLEFVLNKKIPVDKIELRIKKYLKMVGLEGIENEYPDVLSGGMKRRVGIARAFSFPSSYLFMDEPFEFLDIKIKNEIIEYFIKLQNMENKTVIFITHDIESAVSLGEKIVVFSNKPTKIKKIFENPYPKEKNTEKKEKLKDEIERLFL